jgi:hypothetical protein
MEKIDEQQQKAYMDGPNHLARERMKGGHGELKEAEGYRNPKYGTRLILRKITSFRRGGVGHGEFPTK